MNANKMKTIVTEKVSSEFEGLATHDKIYKLGAITLFIYFATGILSFMIFGGESIKTVASKFAYLITMIFAVAVSIEYSILLNRLYSRNWFKWLLGAIAILVYKYSESYANFFINDFTAVDPGLLPAASSVLATLFLPYSWLLTVSTILSIYILTCWILFPFEPLSGQRQLGRWKFIARFFGLFFVFMLILKTSALFESKDSFFVMFSKHIVISTEYFKKTKCLNVSHTEMVADVGNGYISVYNINAGTFRTELCKLEVANTSSTVDGKSSNDTDTRKQ